MYSPYSTSVYNDGVTMHPVNSSPYQSFLLASCRILIAIRREADSSSVLRIE